MQLAPALDELPACFEPLDDRIQRGRMHPDLGSGQGDGDTGASSDELGKLDVPFAHPLTGSDARGVGYVVAPYVDRRSDFRRCGGLG